MEIVSGGILIEVSPGETRAAILDDSGRLIELLIERKDRPSVEGGIYCGRVRRIEQALNGAFVDFGSGQDGFLRRAKGMHEGQQVVVQVQRDAGGGKGATLTDRVSLVGRYLSLTPGRSDISFSRRLGSGRRRAQLERLAERVRSETEHGFALRAAAAFAEDDAIVEEGKRLDADWDALQAAAASAQAPACLMQSPDLLARALRDQEGDRVVIDDPVAHREAEKLVLDRMPDWRGRVERHGGDTPLLESYGVAEEVDGVCDRVHTMPDGIRLTFDPVEALTVIDVDSGAGGRRSSDDAILRVNRAALAEAARQVRLRNLSGLIVVDFLNMRRKTVRSQFLQAARQAFRDDPVQVDVLGLTTAGLLELTRRRSTLPLHEILTESGGARPSAAASACAALRAVLRLKGPGKPVISGSQRVLSVLEGPLAAAHADAGRRMGQAITLRTVATGPDWDVTLERDKAAGTG